MFLNLLCVAILIITNIRDRWIFFLFKAGNIFRQKLSQRSKVKRNTIDKKKVVESVFGDHRMIRRGKTGGEDWGKNKRGLIEQGMVRMG